MGIIPTGNYTMNKLKNLCQVLLGKAAVCAVLAALLGLSATPSFAQTAEVKKVGVYYSDNIPSSLATNKTMYCDYSSSSSVTVSKYFGYTSNATLDSFKSTIAGLSVGDAFSDGTVTWTIQDMNAQPIAIVTACTTGLMDRQANAKYYKNNLACFKKTDTVRILTKATGASIPEYASSSTGTLLTEVDERSFVSTPSPDSNTPTNGDPWVSSALIEYDQPYPTTVPTMNKYPNHCLGLCMDVYCNNLPVGQSTYSIAFPLQEVRFDVVKYYNGKNVENKDDTPPVRTIDLFPGTGNSDNLSSFKCGSYKCSNATWHNSNNTNWGTCVGATYVALRCDSDQNTDLANHPEWFPGGVYSPGDSSGSPSNSCPYLAEGDWGAGTYQQQCIVWDMGSQRHYCHKCGNGSEVSDCLNFNADGARSFGDRPKSIDGWGSPIKFCAAWDGNYEHDGEMGKSNGNFAYRASVHTNTPGDGVIVNGNIEFDSMIAYPGMNQIPIQVDVTNVHTVRSTPSMVGKLTPVAAQPYTLVYRISKDADVRTTIFDASTDNTSLYEINNTGEFAPDTSAAAARIVRTLADWQPRKGEGIKGNDSDKLVNSFENWDGRNKDGILLPAGNYMAAIQAKSQDEWGGVDFSRAVTRQLSLDPLVLTDIQMAGLTKKSTAYAIISYIPTESSNVYWEIYTPGTVFTGTTGSEEGVNTDSSEDTGTSPHIKATANSVPTGSLVYRSVENRTGRAAYTARWDGTCQQDTCVRYYSENETLSNGVTCNSSATAYWDATNKVCKETFAKGSPLPDGNYISVLWAEIPYNGVYKNAAGNNGTPTFVAGGSCPAEQNDKCFTGVKTLKYEVRNLEVERGLVGITIQPVSYSTIGSSPTAYGLDPFIFQYSLDRDAQVIASVQNTAGVPVRYLTPQEGTSNVSQQFNRLSWDGRDEKGRMVTPGTYMFVVEAHDAMFPSRSNRATAVFPVDMYRITDLTTTDVYGDSTARATVSYLLSKAMNVQVNIYNKDVVIPNYNSIIGDYGGTAAWPPRVCNQADDVFDGTGAVSPAKVAAGGATTACIYVNDAAFVKSMYPATATAAADTDNLNVRLQPIETFDRSALKSGEGMLIMEEWDALYFYNPKECTSTTTKKKTDCKYGMIPDGQYPFFVSARSNEPFDRYYFDVNKDTSTAYTDTYKVNGEPFKLSTETVQESYLYATEKPVSKINITRGPVYFLDGSVAVYPNAPQLFNASTGPTFIPPYEIDFSVSRASEVEIAIVALQDNVCSPVSTITSTGTANKAGDICKFLSTMTIVNTGNFDADIVRKTFWDGTDHNGNYVKPGIYEVRLTARNYPDGNMYEETVKSITVNADLFKIFDLFDVDSYAISARNTDMHISYQASVPMKVAIQIFKPGTTIYDYSKGTLRNPTTGTEVQDINEVLVRSIVGIRPSMTLIDEVWDGRDYAQQEVPDGTYPFRFVTAVNSSDIDSVTGEILNGDDASAKPSDWKISKVADTYEYQNLHKATIAIGDGRFVCEDWEKTVFFYPNPLNDASKGTLEITKMPVPGTVSIKFFNLAGDLVREGDYTCVDANNYQVQMGSSLYFQPDNNISNTKLADVSASSTFPNVRNAALRCRWDRTNQHGKKVARGVYFGLVDFRAQNGREHCQKVVKIIVP